MESENAVIDSGMVYPILFIPKKCTTLETNCEWTDNVYIDVSITSPDTEGNNTNIYNGFCNIKLVDSYDLTLNRPERSSSEDPDIEKMPVILSETNQLSCPPYSQSQVWIDPSRSPYVYNHYDPSSQEQYSIHESGGLITVEQHNTYITQNVYNCKESNEDEASQSPVRDFECKQFRRVQETVTTVQPDANMGYYEEDEFECGVFLTQLPEEIMNENQARAREEQKFVNNPSENNALKQLMSSEIQSTSKQRKTILFLGHDSQSGQTIQNISYNDPLVKCAEMEVDNEVIIDESSSPNPAKKRYQCDKCKQIFDQISTFRQHMVGDHNHYKTVSQPAKQLGYTCTDCGKKLKNQWKLEVHCLGHGDPDLECPKCRKVFASKFSLRVHSKIHNRKYPCNYCIKSYGRFEELKTHIEKIHFLYMCKDENCSNADKPDRTGHHWHKSRTEDDQSDVDDPITEAVLKSEVERIEHVLMSPDLATQNCAVSTRDIPLSDWAISSQDLETENVASNHDWSSHDLGTSSQNMELGTPSRGVSRQDLEISSANLELGTPVGTSGRDWASQDMEAPLSREGSRSSAALTLALSPEAPGSAERARQADDVIAKVMSDTIFLLSSKKARKHRSRKTCEVCLKPFDRIDDLKRHLIEHVIKSTLAKTPVSRTGCLNITCEVCQMDTFNKVDKYKAHLREHAKLTIYKCTFCDKSFSDSSNFSKHKKIHGISYLQCDLCLRKFNSKKMIAQHMEHHETTSPVKCGHCSRMFHFESMLKKHIRCAHRKEETSKFRCRFCEGIFESSKEKWDHEWSAHNIRKMIVDCLICGSQFRKYSELRRHCLDEHNVVIPPAKKLLKRGTRSLQY